MFVIPRESKLWEYMPTEIRDLIEDGETILNFVHKYKDSDEVSDYSFLVFPFAKAYEGFIKRLLLDVGMIREDEYYSDEIRIGRLLNPNYRDKTSLYRKLSKHLKEGEKISEYLWAVWKEGRNLVFHYFPHNFRRLTYNEALNIVNKIVDAMHKAVHNLPD